MKIKIILSYASLGFILFLFYLGLSSNPQYETKNLVGKKIVSFELESLLGDNKINNEDLKKNNYTLINFWASWCGPCRLEHKYLILLSKNQHLKILGVNFKDKKNSALEFLHELGNPYYNIAKDNQGKASIAFGIYGIPESILIDNDLKVIKKFVGPISVNNYKTIIKLLKNK